MPRSKYPGEREHPAGVGEGGLGELQLEFRGRLRKRTCPESPGSLFEVMDNRIFFERLGGLRHRGS
jgi:hypothetical protein